MSLRKRRLFLRLGLHGGSLVVLYLGFVLGVAAGYDSLASFFGLLFLTYLGTMRANPLPRLLEQHWFQWVECYACGARIDLVDTWACGCGFQTWQPRSALSPCSYCHRSMAWIECPGCQASILT